MKFSEFAGMDAKMEQLMRSAQAGRIVHALLFTGPRGTGKKSMAEIFARAVLCEGENKPCDQCPTCKKCLNGNHPDIHVVAPEKKEIKVDQIRALNEALGLASYEGGKKIAIIEPADAMNEKAQNALLKTLEEPKGDTLFFLLTATPEKLLPTIVSRCLQVRFSCLELDACAEVLKERGVAADRAVLLAALAQGSVGRALEIDADEKYLPLRTKVIDALEGIRKPADVARMAASIGDVKGREQAVLEMMELWARDLMRVQNGAEPLDESEIERLKRSKHTGSALLKRIMEMRRQLDANIAWANAFEAMAFDLAQGKV